MVYVDLTSFFEAEVSSGSIKQELLHGIAVDQAGHRSTMDVEYNVYQLLIHYQDQQVELWDTMMMGPDEEQEPFTMPLDAFLAALHAYVPAKP
ncbi:hypothetical protein I2I05_13385 [Hymenobacter sp. BT683]|uniref:Uncharacterized protein n=1 Tax=Hymenobacter jeongseonensis TaxID=2791027 RepID=A0ABS0IJQ8_9BACT|nr:hypothetical protein [Hymenobacter jeongseonensis]MBF9238392.1 hypothetical protein [Hymenobacter jeongseonensis]